MPADGTLAGRRPATKLARHAGFFYASNPMLSLRFILPLILTITALAVIAAPLAENLLSRWFHRDVELRAKLIFQSVEDRLADLWSTAAKPARYIRLFDNIARDERVLAAALCFIDPKPLSESKHWPAALPCPKLSDQSAPVFEIHDLQDRRVLAGIFPLPVAGPGRPALVILHDLVFSANRAADARFYLIAFLVVVCFAAAFVTLLTARLTLRDWIGRLRLTLSDPHAPLLFKKLPREFLPVVREIRQMLREIRPGAHALGNIRIDWTPQTLKRLLETELPGSEVIVVSNREPYIHNLHDGQPRIQRPASGVVTALEPIMRACGGIWIAHGSGTADRLTTDDTDRLAVPPEHPEYTLRRIWLTPEEEQGYYYGLANEGLWPLCHIAFVRPSFRETDWQMYKAVNRKFADAVIREAKTPNPIVLVQDYHFALLPRYVRERLPDATIITFWHIPWPNAEVFGICPWRDEVLSGLLGSSVLGFHTQFHCQNFMDTADRFLACHIDRDQSVLTAGDHATLIRPYPISIAWPPEGLETVPAAAACRAAVAARFHIAEGIRIGVGVERFDYTKGIHDRLLGVREFLLQHPEWRGRFTFIQAAAPTRSQLPAYHATQQETFALAEAINQEFGQGAYQPVILLARHHEPPEVFELFRAADLCIVSSLHDGMNLVAKEFIAARDDETGVLILSTFAGAAKELIEALLVNPYDTAGTAQAIHRALTMPDDEQKERMRLLREMVSGNNVYYWAARMLLDAAHLRKRARIEQFVSQRSLQDDFSSHAVPYPPRA